VKWAVLKLHIFFMATLLSMCALTSAVDFKRE